MVIWYFWSSIEILIQNAIKGYALNVGDFDKKLMISFIT